MPEGPELHLAARLVNAIAGNRLFSGKVKKSEVSTKNPDVDWDEESYKISATARGKEVKLTLRTFEDNGTKKNKKKSISVKSLDVVFRFGMSGKFTFEPIDQMHKHAHLQFYTKEGDMVLSFTDYRRFGKWEPGGDWGPDRGPCIITEFDKFRENVLDNIEKAAFNKPICEAMLNQKFFNGIGNYLRAEILYRLNIAPFTQARKVLEPLAENREVKRETSDILDLCHLLPHEVLNLCDGTSTGYDAESGGKEYSAFNNWLQCYYQDGMTNMVDHNGRTMWFKGPAGPMTPSSQKSRTKRKSGSKKDSKSPSKKPKKEEVKLEGDEGETGKKKVKVAARKKVEPTQNGHDYTSFSPKKTRSRVKALKEEQPTVKKTGRSKRK